MNISDKYSKMFPTGQLHLPGVSNVSLDAQISSQRNDNLNLNDALYNRWIVHESCLSVEAELTSHYAGTINTGQILSELDAKGCASKVHAVHLRPSDRCGFSCRSINQELQKWAVSPTSNLSPVISDSFLVKYMAVNLAVESIKESQMKNMTQTSPKILSPSRRIHLYNCFDTSRDASENGASVVSSVVSNTDVASLTISAATTSKISANEVFDISATEVNDISATVVNDTSNVTVNDVTETSPPVNSCISNLRVAKLMELLTRQRQTERSEVESQDLKQPCNLSGICNNSSLHSQPASLLPCPGQSPDCSPIGNRASKIITPSKASFLPYPGQNTDRSHIGNQASKATTSPTTLTKSSHSIHSSRLINILSPSNTSYQPVTTSRININPALESCDYSPESEQSKESPQACQQLDEEIAGKIPQQQNNINEISTEVTSSFQENKQSHIPLNFTERKEVRMKDTRESSIDNSSGNKVTNYQSIYETSVTDNNYKSRSDKFSAEVERKVKVLKMNNSKKTDHDLGTLQTHVSQSLHRREINCSATCTFQTKCKIYGETRSGNIKSLCKNLGKYGVISGDNNTSIDKTKLHDSVPEITKSKTAQTCPVLRYPKSEQIFQSMFLRENHHHLDAEKSWNLSKDNGFINLEQYASDLFCQILDSDKSVDCA